MIDLRGKTVGILRPTTAGPEDGNRTTAARWEKLLRDLGARVFQERTWSGRPCEVLIALHASKSHDSIVSFHRAHPSTPIVLCGTGTDLYLSGDAARRAAIEESLALTTRIVVLQPLALLEIPEQHRPKARVIYQAFPDEETTRATPPDRFQVVLLANVRAVKDPIIALDACEFLPADSPIRIVHAGSTIDADLGRELQQRAETCPFFETRGPLPRQEALDLLGASHLLLSTSRHEGGANVLSEALALGVPILASAIPGSLGILGEDYPGTYPPGDAGALAERLLQCEANPRFLDSLSAACSRRAALVEPRLELRAWSELLSELLG